MTAALLALLITPALASPLDEGAAVELRYTGTLTKAGRTPDAGEAVKRFSLYAFVVPTDAGKEIAYIVDERGGGGWAWPERFGVLTVDAVGLPTSPAQLRLLYDHEGNLTPVRLPRPLFEHRKEVAKGASFKAANESYEVGPQTVKQQNRDVWPVVVANNFGRKRTLWIDAESPLVVAAEERVFVGQGVEFSLKIQLDAIETLDAERLAQVRKPLDLLLKLQADLQRKENEATPELSEEQLATAAKALAAIEAAAAETPFSRLASVVSKDVKTQQQRTGEVAQLAQKFVGKPAPEFTLQTLDKQTSTTADRTGKIVVLHFWDYRDDPLVEPYGQVGYLDFLYSRRRKLGVEVYGVAVDERLGDKAQATQALRGINKLKAFMNLGYPIALDSGAVIEKFGDPRTVGAKLPLWVVIGPDGTIAHYSNGFFKINPDEGLRQLDEVVVELIKKQREKDK